jgi:uncharacterized membrane protein
MSASLTLKWTHLLVFLVALLLHADVEAFHVTVSHPVSTLALKKQHALLLPRRSLARPSTASVRMASGIDTLPLVLQSSIFLGTMSGVTAGGLLLAGPILDGAQRALGEERFKLWSATFSLLGFVYLFSGFAHFTLAEPLKGIYPPMGTWGLWQLPGSADFHVAWTGVAEILGSLGLLIGSLAGLAPQELRPSMIHPQNPLLYLMLAQREVAAAHG